MPDPLPRISRVKKALDAGLTIAEICEKLDMTEYEVERCISTINLYESIDRDLGNTTHDSVKETLVVYLSVEASKPQMISKRSRKTTNSRRKKINVLLGQRDVDR